MKAVTKLLVTALLCSLILSSALPFAHAATVSEFEPDIPYNAKAVYLYSYDAKRVLYAKGEDLTLAPASSAKMMSGLIVCELFADRLDQTVTVSADMLSGISGTSMGLKAGMTLTVKDLLYGTVCGVNNDAATVLAIACMGSIEAFTQKMNDYAALLDMRSTHYSNPTGVDSTSAKTTVLDTAKLAAKAAENQLYLKISTTPEYKINDTVTVYNRNALVSQFSAQGYLNKNARGLIAGSTDQGGFILAALAQRNERSFLCVVMGATADENEIYSYKTASDLFTYAFNGYTGKILGYAGDKVTSIEVKLALDVKSAPTVNCVIAEDVYAVIPDDAETSDISFKYYLHEDTLTAPIEKNSVIGGIDFYYKGAKIAEGKLVTEKDVSENSLLVFLDNMKNAFISPFFLITVLLIVTFTLTYLYLKRKTAFRGRVNKRSRKIRI